jgi:hypothetical protein
MQRQPFTTRTFTLKKCIWGLKMLDQLRTILIHSSPGFQFSFCCNKVLLSTQPCEDEISIQCLADCLDLHHRGSLLLLFSSQDSYSFLPTILWCLHLPLLHTLCHTTLIMHDYCPTWQWAHPLTGRHPAQNIVKSRNSINFIRQKFLERLHNYPLEHKFHMNIQIYCCQKWAH